jgi:UDP-2-acetamido-3-amino-2,3-dideoxy-glucuronate N-acetyltransferase
MGFFKHERALVDEKAQIGDDTRIWANAHVQGGAIVGQGCNICNGSFIEKGAVIGNHVTIKHNVSIFDGVTIEDDVFIGSNIAFINDRFPRSNRKDEWVLEKTLIKKGATLGSNAVVMCGLTIGEYAFVGAGSVVTSDVIPHGLVFGNPAKLKGYACICGRKLDQYYDCKGCGRKFSLSPKGIKLE